MEQADVLFAEYVAAHRAGNVDPVPFLDRADDADREALITLIDAYLVASPGRAWDPVAFADSPVERLVDPLTRALSGVSGTWPVLLPSLRRQARIKRTKLVERLAEGLGFPDRDQRIAEYYHDMEHGTLNSSGVSDRVLEVLSGILGTGAEALRKAGETVSGGEFPREQAVFARTPSVDGDSFASITANEESESDQIVPDGQASPASDLERRRQTADAEIDRLFTGGDA